MTSLEQHLAAHQLGERIDNNTLVCTCGDFVRDMPGTYDDPYSEHRAHVAATWHEARTVLRRDATRQARDRNDGEWELCGDTLADTDCPDCYGSGGTASGDECQKCEGARKIHVGCVGVSHRDLMKNLADLTEERDEQLAAIAEWQRSALIVITAANQFVMDCVTGDGNPVTIAKALIDSGFDGRNER